MYLGTVSPHADEYVSIYEVIEKVMAICIVNGSHVDTPDNGLKGND